MINRTHNNPRHKTARVIIISLLFAGLSFETFLFMHAHKVSHAATIDAAASLAHCHNDAKMNGDVVNECILDTVKSTLLNGDLAAAYNVFETAYRTFPEFSEGSCHNQAHRVGDMFYYNYFLKQGRDLSLFDYPQVTTACGYGFFHGLFEHLIQDHPDPAYVTTSCEYLRGRLSKNMNDIGTICYHGSGHGFVLARADKVPKEKWGDVHSFVDTPIAQCEALEKASVSEKGDCKTGVFNVILAYMEDKNYGFVYPEAHPLAYCAPLPDSMRDACLFEMAQKLDRVSRFDPMELRTVVAEAGTESAQHEAFAVGIAGIVQHTVNKGDGYDDALGSCMGLNDDYFGVCIDSIVHGLFDHGDPLLQYEKPLAMCADARIAKRGFKDKCYQSVMTGLRRYFDPTRRLEICKEFPENERKYCSNEGM